jgi:hypothetical protein
MVLSRNKIEIIGARLVFPGSNSQTLNKRPDKIDKTRSLKNLFEISL